MAFGLRPRSQQSSRANVDDAHAHHAAHHSSAPSSARPHSSSNGQDAPAPAPGVRQPLHRIRLDGDPAPPPAAPQSHNNYLQQRLERAVASASAAGGSHAASSSARRDRELSSRTLESAPHARSARTMTTAGPVPPSLLDEHAQGLDLPRRRRGTTSAYSSARSTTSSSAGMSDSEHRAPEPRVDVLHKGPLFVKRGLLKGLEKRFYFVTRGAPELYCCKDETSFNLWHASGWGLDAGAGGVAKASGLAPLLVCSVLRADRAGDSGGSDRGIVLVAAPAPGAAAAKPTTLKVYAESAERCERWLRALHRVQLSQRAAAPDEPASPLSSTAKSSGSSGGSAAPRGDDVVASPRVSALAGRPRQASVRSDASQPSSLASSGHGAPRAYAHGQLRSRDGDGGSVKSSGSSSDAASGELGARPAALFGSMLAGAHSSSQGNVLLFVPAAGSAISVSDSRLAAARQQLAALEAAGGKRPARRGLEPSAVNAPGAWRYGAPEFALADLEYMRHHEREHESTPLESYVEECCQTFLMEATHRARYADWRSVRQDRFFLQVNDGPRVPGAALDEHAMFGLLCVGAGDGAAAADDGGAKHPRAVLAEALTDGFPMEVLEVFTQPPTCYFSWRHWGAFSGSFRGVKGDGARVEVRGFGLMHVEENRMESLRLFFKPTDLFDQLARASAALGAKARDAQRARAVSSAVPPAVAAAAAAAGSSAAAAAASRSTAATSTVASSTASTTSTPSSEHSHASAAAPTRAAPTKSKATLTADIMSELAGFTIASSAATARGATVAPGAAG